MLFIKDGGSTTRVDICRDWRSRNIFPGRKILLKFHVNLCIFMYLHTFVANKQISQKHASLQTNLHARAHSKDISFFAIVVQFFAQMSGVEMENFWIVNFEHSRFSQKHLKLKGFLEQEQARVCETLTAVSLLRCWI